MKFKNKCPECGGDNLTWDQTSRSTSGVVEGRLRTNEVTVVFFLGCNDCSATVQTVSSDGIAAHLNSQMAVTQPG
jgi:hypothetical protein